MVDGIISWCLRNTFLVFVAVIAALIGGWYALENTPVDAIPDIGALARYVGEAFEEMTATFDAAAR